MCLAAIAAGDVDISNAFKKAEEITRTKNFDRGKT